MTTPQPLPSGYYSSSGRCPTCARMLIETDRLDDETIWACPNRCGMGDDDELRAMIVEGPDVEDREAGRP